MHSVFVTLTRKIPSQKLPQWLSNKIPPGKNITVFHKFFRFNFCIPKHPFQILDNSFIVKVGNGKVRFLRKIKPFPLGKWHTMDLVTPTYKTFLKKTYIIIWPPSGVFNPFAKNNIFSGQSIVVSFRSSYNLFDFFD